MVWLELLLSPPPRHHLPPVFVIGTWTRYTPFRAHWSPTKTFLGFLSKSLAQLCHRLAFGGPHDCRKSKNSPWKKFQINLDDNDDQGRGAVVVMDLAVSGNMLAAIGAVEELPVEQLDGDHSKYELLVEEMIELNYFKFQLKLLWL